MTAIPTTPDELTPAWLTEALGSAPGDVQGVRIRTAEADSGMLSLICFLELELKPGVDLPGKLVAKLAPTYEGAAALVSAFGLFARESQFYERIAPRLSIRTPRAFHCDHDPDTGLGVLVLEDCSHMRAPRQTDEQPTTLEELELLVDAAARMAISSWNADWLETEPEVLAPDHPVSQAYFHGIEASFPAFMESEFFDLVPADFRPVAERLCREFATLTLRSRPTDNLSLCHLDYRLANVFFDDAADDPVVVIDWASMYPGRTAHDVGFLISNGYSAEFRRRHEEDLVRRYHETLLRAGVTDYSWDDAWFDYRHGMVIGLRLLPMFINDLDTSTEGGAAIAHKIYATAPQAVLDHGGLELLDEVLARARARP